MHHEFAFESYEYHIDNFEDKADFLFIKTWCLEPEIMEFALANGSEKTADIIKTIKGMSGYRRPTDKQKAAIALDLLSNRTAREILVGVYGDKIAVLFSERESEKAEKLSGDLAATELASHGIEIGSKRVAFSDAGQRIASKHDVSTGNTYRASVRAVKALEMYADGFWENNLVEIGKISGELIALTHDEMKKLGLKDQSVLDVNSGRRELRSYIEQNYGGNQAEFARVMGVTRHKVSEWISNDWIVYKGKLWSSRRDLPVLTTTIHEREKEELDIPGEDN
jgi:hypothetical protein